MGISSSKSKTKTSQTESSTSNPITPPWLSQPIQGITNKIDAFSNMPADQFVASPSAIQQGVFDQVGNLGGYTQTIDDAVGMAKAAGAMPAPTLGKAAQASVTNWSAPNLGMAAQTGAVNLAPSTYARPESLLDNLNAYMDPYTNQVVNATLANYDADTGQRAAQLAAQAAGSGAFGGSRYGIAQGQFQADAGRDRAQTEYGLRSDAFRTGAALSSQDAQRRQDVNLANAGWDNNRSVTQGQMDLQRMLADIGYRNQFTLAQGDLNARAAQDNANNATQASMYNAGQANSFASLEAQLQEQQAQRALQAAGLVGNLGVAGNAADATNLQLAADIGAQQRAIESARLNAIPTQLQIAGSLLSGLPYPAIVGQQSDGTMEGTSVTKTSPGLGVIGAGLLGSALGGWAGGGLKFG
jgi:hypothetical protein